MTSRTPPTPKVSIGLPVHNGERYLDASLSALRAQTCPDFEILVFDNASTDATEEIARRHAAEDARITYHRNETNLGAAPNFNLAPHAARGIYFKWAAHDDLCAPTFLERCVEVLDSDSSVVLAYPQTRIIDEHGATIEDYDVKLPTDDADRLVRFESLLHGHRCFEVFGLIRREALMRTDLIGSYAHGDGVLLAHLALLGRFEEVPEPLFRARRHAGQSMEVYRGDYDAWAAWFDRNLRPGTVRPWWRIYRELWRAVGRSNLPWRDRLRCYRLLLRWMNYRRDRLWAELRGRRPAAAEGPRTPAGS